MRAPAAALAILALALPAAAQDLAAALRHALQNDSRLAAAAAQRDAQFEKIEQGRAGLLPRIGLSAGVNRYSSSMRGFSDTAGDAPAVRSTNVAVTMVQPLFNRTAALARDLGPLQAELGEAQWLQARAELGSRVVQAWFDALAAQGQAELVQRQRVLMQSRLQDLQAAAGASDNEPREAERRDLESRWRRQQIDERLARSQLQARRQALAALAGPLPTRLQPPRLSGTEARIQARTWVEQADDRAPLARLQRVQLDMAENQVAQGRAAHAPVVELSASYSNDRGFQMLPGGTIVGRAVGVQVQLPLFDGFASVSRTREALHLRDKARHELAAARATAAQDAATASFDLEMALTRREACAQPEPAGVAAGSLDLKLEQLAAQRDCERALEDAAAALWRLRLQSGSFTDGDLDAWMTAGPR